MAGLLDDPTQQQAGITGQNPVWASFFGAPGPANQQPPGPAPLTPQQIAFQQAQAGTPLPQGFNPAMMGGNMAGMPMPQGFTGGMGAGMPSPTMGFGGAQPQASMGGLNQAGLNAAGAGLNLMQNSQPHTAGAPVPSMLGGGGAVHTASMGPGGAGGTPALNGGMGGGMLNPQLLKMLMGAGNGTA